MISLGIQRKIYSPQKYIGEKLIEKIRNRSTNKKDNTLLLELHISPGKVHPNPDGKKIIGSHWHIYSEEYGRRKAFPAEDINSENFVDNTIRFLEEFNVIENPLLIFSLNW